MRTVRFDEKWSTSVFQFADKSEIDRASAIINEITTI